MVLLNGASSLSLCVCACACVCMCVLAHAHMHMCVHPYMPSQQARRMPQWHFIPGSGLVLCQIQSVTVVNSGQMMFNNVVALLIFAWSFVLLPSENTCTHSEKMYRTEQWVSFVADEDLRGRNVLLLTSFCHCYMKCSQYLEKCLMP